MCTTPDNASEAGLTNSRGWRTSHFDEELNGKSGTALVERDWDAQIALYEKIQPIIDDKATSIQQLSERGVTAAYQGDVSEAIIDPWERGSRTSSWIPECPERLDDPEGGKCDGHPRPFF
ncbi:MAG: hypothetical protein GYB50_13305 [Rhodobacteraceae bacterium]|nr:hypothetical protein [Paracoccaceae bacterium]